MQCATEVVERVAVGNEFQHGVKLCGLRLARHHFLQRSLYFSGLGRQLGRVVLHHALERGFERRNLREVGVGVHKPLECPVQGLVQRDFFAAGLVDEDRVGLRLVPRLAFFDELDLDFALACNGSLDREGKGSLKWGTSGADIVKDAVEASFLRSLPLGLVALSRCKHKLRNSTLFGGFARLADLQRAYVEKIGLADKSLTLGSSPSTG